ncbi:MAG: polysaccharide deacetylase family protein [Bacteroidales bacterium]|nr:polysaccharide deacetylase family protein [Bacteroidales bacterium]
MDSAVVVSHGGVVRGSIGREEVSLIFTADSMFEGVDTILKALDKAGVTGAFFFTEYVLNNHPQVVGKIKDKGHYIGHHGYHHLLYCDWATRDSTFITREEFDAEMDSADRSLGRYSISRRDAPVFVPPFEWYNDSIGAWARDKGLQVVSFTYGFPTSEDYTLPSMGDSYVSTEEIFKRLRARPIENGTIFLVHMGVKPERPEPLYNHLGALLSLISQKGFNIVPLMDLISPRLTITGIPSTEPPRLR